MRLHFKPKTKLGEFSAWLIVLFAVCLGAYQVMGSGLAGATLFARLFTALLSSPAPMFGTAALITGIISILRNKERAVAVYLAVVFGSFGLFALIVILPLLTRF